MPNLVIIPYEIKKIYIQGLELVLSAIVVPSEEFLRKL